jgi:hypothetical protein
MTFPGMLSFRTGGERSREWLRHGVDVGTDGHLCSLVTLTASGLEFDDKSGGIFIAFRLSAYRL